MVQTNMLRQAARMATRPLQSTAPRASMLTRQSPITLTKSFATTSIRHDKDGNFATTDESVRIQHPDEKDLPSSKPVQGRGGTHNKRTLASFSLEGKTAVVTGGARGLGLVMSQALVISGADLAIVDMNKDEAEKQAEALVQSYKNENPGETRTPKITAHYCDVSNPTSVKQAFDDIVSKQGKVDTMITSAGFTENFDAINYPFDRVQKAWGVNVDGTYLFAIECAKHMIERDAPGSITFIGSMSGAIVNVPQPQAPYNAAKAAVRHLAASLAVEWAQKNIRVNCISPGYMLTALTEKILNEKPALKEKWTSLIPMGKMGNPEDLMGVAVFLASDASKYVTGAEIRVDGGYTCT